MDTSTTTGITCPKCSGFIPLSLFQLVSCSEFVCPQCGLRLSIDRKQSKQSMGALEKIKRAERGEKKTDA